MAKMIAIDSGNAKELARLVLPKDEADPLWDHRMELPVDKALAEDMAEREMQKNLTAIPGEGDTLRIKDGKRRFRALPLANEIRKKAKKAPLVLYVRVDEEDEFTAMESSQALNAYGLKSDPVTLALDMQRLFVSGVPEEKIAKDNNMSVASFRMHLELLGMDKEFQQAVRDGKLSLSAALLAGKLSDDEAKARLRRDIAAATPGRKVASAKGLKGGNTRLSVKATLKLIEEIKKVDLAGEHGKAVKQTVLDTLELTLDDRRLEEFFQDLDHHAKGKK